jgi:hypothetical protein
MRTFYDIERRDTHPYLKSATIAILDDVSTVGLYALVNNSLRSMTGYRHVKSSLLSRLSNRSPPDAAIRPALPCRVESTPRSDTVLPKAHLLGPNIKWRRRHHDTETIRPKCDHLLLGEVRHLEGSGRHVMAAFPALESSSPSRRVVAACPGSSVDPDAPDEFDRTA